MVGPDETDGTDGSGETGETDESVAGDEIIDEATGDENELGVDLDAALASLTEAFEQALSQLLESASTASQMPPLSSPPTGQGGAYDKFLAIYESILQGTTEPPADQPQEPPAEPENDEPIDVVV